MQTPASQVGDGGGVPWVPLVAAAGAVAMLICILIAIIALLARRRRRPQPKSPAVPAADMGATWPAPMMYSNPTFEDRFQDRFPMVPNSAYEETGLYNDIPLSSNPTYVGGPAGAAEDGAVGAHDSSGYLQVDPENEVGIVNQNYVASSPAPPGVANANYVPSPQDGFLSGVAPQ